MVDQQSYDGFISYSHSADDLLAPRLQAGLQRFAKPWWKRRAVRIFRDESSLAANPHLWSSITEALESSGWFVLLLSPDAASSEWVGKEIEHWKATKPADRILPVVTDGEFGWSDGDVAGSSVPPALHGVFSEEPRWVDLRFARNEEHLDLQSPTFSAAVADIASAIRGVPKDELESEEVRQHRRTVRTAWAAGALVTVLAIASVGFGVQSSRNANEAERQARIASENESTALAEADRADRNADEAEANAKNEAEARADAERNFELAEARALASSAVAVLARDPELSTLLAVHAIDQTPEGQAQPIEVINALWRAGGANRLVDVFPTEAEASLALSADGTRLVVTAEPHELRMLDAASGEVLWTYTEDTVDSFNYVDVGADGRVAMAVLDSESPHARNVAEETDNVSSRIVILDQTGAATQILDYSGCQGKQQLVWSPDGRYLAVSSGDNPICAREGIPFWIEVFDTETWQPVAFLPTGVDWAPRPAWDDIGVLYALTWPILAFEPETFAPRTTGVATGLGDVSPDGSSLVLNNMKEPPASGPFSAFLVDVATGAVHDVLYNGDDPVLPHTGIEITSDGRYAVLHTVGSDTFVYDMGTSREVFRLPTGQEITSAYDPVTERLYTSGTEPGVRVWDLRESTVGVTPTGSLGEFSWVNGNGFSPGPDLVAIDTLNVREWLWAAQMFAPLTGEITGEPVYDVLGGQALSNGNFVFVDQSESGTDGPVLFDPETQSRTELLPCETPAMDQGGRFCADESGPRTWAPVVPVEGDRILAYGSNGVLDFEYSGHFRVLDADTGAILGSADPGVEPEADPLQQLDERGRYTATRSPVLTEGWIFGLTAFDFGVGAFDLATGEVLYQDPLGQAFDSTTDAGLVSYNRGGNAVSIVDTTTWTEIARVEANGRVRGHAFNADGSLFAMGDVNTLKIVDVVSGLVVQQMDLPNVSDIHWSDDEMVVVGTSSGVFGTLSLSTEDFLKATRDRLRRSFTDQECMTYRIDPCPSLDDMRGR